MRRRWWLLGLGSFTVTLLLLLTVLLPAIDPRYSLFNFLSQKQNEMNPLENPGDPPGHPYIYWTAPANSFGVSSFTTVNVSYFWLFFNTFTHWSMYAKRQNGASYENVSSYLIVNDNVSNATISQKTSLDITAPFRGSYYINFTINRVLQNWSNTSNNWILTYDLDNNESYQVFFNFSDIRATGLFSIKPEITDNKFRLSVFRANVPNGWHHVIDPTFGYTGTASGVVHGSRYYIIGARVNCTEAGTADYIKVEYNNGWSTHEIQGALTSVAGTVIANGRTERKNITAAWGPQIIQLNFTGTKPTVAAQEYLIVVGLSLGNDDGLGVYADDSTAGTLEMMYYGPTPVPMPSSFTPSFSADHRVHIYCSYTVSGAAWKTTQTLSGASQQIHNDSYWRTIQTITGLIHNDTAWRTRQTITGLIHNDTGWRTTQTIIGLLHNDSYWRTAQTITGLLHNDSVWRTTQTISGLIHNDSTSQWRTTQTLTGLLHNDSYWRTWQTITGLIHNDTGWRTRQTITGLIHNDTGWRTRQTITGKIHNDSIWRLVQTITGLVHNDSTPGKWYTTQTISGRIHNDSLAPSGFGGNTRSVVPFLLIGFFGGFMVGMVFYHRGRKKKTGS